MTAMTARRAHLSSLSLPRIGAWSGSISIHVFIAALLLATVSPTALRLIRHQADQTALVSVVLKQAAKPLKPIPATPVPPKPAKPGPTQRLIAHRVAISAPPANATTLPFPSVSAPAPIAMPTLAQSDTPPTALAYGADTSVPYPIDALRRHEQGTVLLRVLVGANGNVVSLAVERSSGSPLLDRAALDAVRHWQFEPATHNGVASRAWARVPITFALSIP